MNRGNFSCSLFSMRRCPECHAYGRSPEGMTSEGQMRLQFGGIDKAEIKNTTSSPSLLLGGEEGLTFRVI
jgi:hypothetical protein